MDPQDTIRRVRYFDRQLLQVQDFTDEQAYHIRMRRIHNRFLHSYGVLDGLELHLDPHGRILTVEEGVALDEQGQEIVLPHQETLDLTAQAGKTLYVTVGYRERETSPGAGAGAQGFARVEEYPQIVLSETPPRAGEMLILGRVVVGPDGAATTLDDGVYPYQRRNSGGAGGDLEGRTLTLSGAGAATEWPRLRMSEPRTASLEGGLRVGGELRVAERAVVAGGLGVGTETPRARLHVQHVSQGSDGDALVVGPVEGANLRLGHHHDYSWMQSHGSRPLRINEIGNDVSIAGNGNGRVGIGTHEPAQALHVASAGDAVGLFQSRGSSAFLSLATRDGMDHHVEVANRAGGRLSLWVAGGGDVVNVTRDGRVGIGTEYPAGRFHVRADDRVGLFESIGEHAYLRLATREGEASGVQLAAHPGGRLALGTAEAADAVSVTRDGQVGVGTAEPQARLHVAGDLVVDGEIRVLRGQTEALRWTARPNGLVFEGAVGIGTNDPEAKLQIIHTPQDANGDALVLGPESASNLRLGYHTDYSWIQSHGRRPLRINEMGNDLLLNLGGGNVGVGTALPQARVHVVGDVFVEGKIRTAAGELTPGAAPATPVPASGDTLRVPRTLTVGPTTISEVEGRLHLSGAKSELSVQDRDTPEFAGKAGQRYVWYVKEGRARFWTEEQGDLLSLGADGSVGIGTDTPRARLEVVGGALMPSAGKDEKSGILFPPDPGGGAGDRAWMRYYPRAGEAMTLELGTSNDGDDHIALMPSGSVGVGVNAPTHRLHVRGTDPIALFESTGKMAYLRLAANGKLEDRVEFCNRGDGQLALWVPGGSDSLVIAKDGRMVLGRNQDSNGRVKPQGDIDLRGETVFTGRDGNPGAQVVIRGDLVVEGGLKVGGPKGGYLADQFVNLTGDTLEEGDVVVIGESHATLFYGERGNIPIPEVDLTEMVMDRRVCGIVAQAHDGEDTEGMLPVSTAPDGRDAASGDGGEDADPRRVTAGQRGMMVTMGAFAHCKVDADFGAIEVGDLLTTSATKGHAQRVDDPSLATGAIVGKALASLKKGRGKIPVMVMLH